LLDAIDDDGRASNSIRLSNVGLAKSVEDTNRHAMVLVAAGRFSMGPSRREIHIDAFYMDRTPVTNEQFQVFIDATRYEPDDDDDGRFLTHWRKGRYPRGLERHPVTFVSWFDARAYAAWAGRRLPTEAEWEKAARGTDGRKYPWGKSEPTASHASFARAHDGTTPVGSYPDGASPCGALDMAGNVWEWCDDVDDEAFYENGPPMNPRSTASLGNKRARYVMRGGSFMYDARALRTFARIGFDPHYRFAEGGFRCAKSVG
jgi:serine/threonine-protein kinase